MTIEYLEDHKKLLSNISECEAWPWMYSGLPETGCYG